MVATSPTALFATLEANRRWVTVITLVVAVLVPFVVPRVTLFFLITMLMFSVLTSTLDILVGYTGYLNLAHATFFGLGGYIIGRLVVDFGVPYIAALGVAILAVCVVALLIGFASARVGGVYFAIVTFALAIIFEFLARSLTGITGGASGIPGVPNVSFFGFGIESFTGYYLLFLALLLGTLYLKRLLRSVRAGRAMIAIREDEQLAKSIGINTTRYKLFAVVMSSVMAAMAGAFWVSFVKFVGPGTGGFFRSFNIFVMLIVGGAGTLLGPIVGATLVTFIRDVISPVSAQFTNMLFGVFLVVTIIWMPEGIYPRVKSYVWSYEEQTEPEAQDPSQEDQSATASGGESDE